MNDKLRRTVGVLSEFSRLGFDNWIAVRLGARDS